MRGFLLANLFLLALVLVGAGFAAAGAALVNQASQAGGQALAIAWILAGAGASVATWYMGAAAHGALARWLSR